MNRDTLYTLLKRDEEEEFSGWDFSYLTNIGRTREAPLGWNYASKIMWKLREIDSLLDMGTGGGEFLSLLAPLPRKTFATEGYLPNVSVARNRLEPLGVTVMEIDGDDDLPFAAESFEMVINRHESFSAKEVYRILKPGGQFVTQQVGGENDTALNRLLHAPIPTDYAHWNLPYAVHELEQAGFTILEQKEEFPATRYYDTGAIVYYLKAIPWQVPDFTVERYLDALLTIQQKIDRDGYIDIPSHRFLIIAQR